mgnify:CR=1 FL=1
MFYGEYDDENESAESQNSEDDDGYYSEESRSVKPLKKGKTKFIGAVGSKAYYRAETSEEESAMEAGFDSIEEEEYISGMIGNREDQQALEDLRMRKRRRKQR